MDKLLSNHKREWEWLVREIVKLDSLKVLSFFGQYIDSTSIMPNGPAGMSCLQHKNKKTKCLKNTNNDHFH